VKPEPPVGVEPVILGAALEQALLTLMVLLLMVDTTVTVTTSEESAELQTLGPKLGMYKR
jgi:hypothetical protein